MPVYAGPVPEIVSAKADRQIRRLRKEEAESDHHATEVQRRANWMAWLYPRVTVDPALIDAPYKALHPDLGWRRGRDGMIPSRANIENPVWLSFVVSVKTADEIIKRDAVQGANVLSSATH